MDNTGHTTSASLTTRIEQLEAEEEECLKVIFGDSHSDAAYWAAVERKREIGEELERLYRYQSDTENLT